MATTLMAARLTRSTKLLAGAAAARARGLAARGPPPVGPSFIRGKKGRKSYWSPGPFGICLPIWTISTNPPPQRSRSTRTSLSSSASSDSAPQAHCVQRLVHVKELSSCAEQAGVAEAVGRLVPLLRVIVCDPDLSVRQALAEQMIPFATLLLTEPDTRAPGELSGDERGGLTAYECVLQELVPLLTSILGSGPQELSGAAATNNLPLSEAASDALLGLAGLIKPADVGETVLRAVLCLAHDNEIEENRVVATQLLGSLAPVLGPELCRQYVLPDLVCLADDPAFRVRKAAAMRVGAVSTVVGPELTVAKLLPVFEVLARDEIWGVRKASVESLAQVAAVMPLDVRVGSLEKLMHEFHGDSSRWVRISACQALGPFIATLPSEAISTSLLSLFTQLANPTSPTAADSDVAYSCAYNFPGVAQAVGASRWSEIAESFATLAGNIQWKVRRTLSCSLHDLAAVLGSELTESELLPTFDLFIKDLDEVKVGVIQNLAAFIAALTPATRLTYLPVLSDIRAETDNWRFRHLLASQLAAFGAAFPRGAVQETLLPLALALCTDSVAEVRVAGIAQIGKLVKLLVPENSSAATPAAAAEKAAVATGADGELEAASPDSVVDSPFRRPRCLRVCRHNHRHGARALLLQACQLRPDLLVVDRGAADESSGGRRVTSAAAIMHRSRRQRPVGIGRAAEDALDL